MNIHVLIAKNTTGVRLISMRDTRVAKVKASGFTGIPCEKNCTICSLVLVPTGCTIETYDTQSVPKKYKKMDIMTLRDGTKVKVKFVDESEIETWIEEMLL